MRVQLDTFQLIPQFRNNCVIQAKKAIVDNYNIGDSIYIISKNPLKKFSISSLIEGIIYNETNCIYIDKRILGKFCRDEKVYLLPNNPNNAKEIHLAVSKKYTNFSSGDWTNNLSNHLQNKIIDYGDMLNFVIPFRDEQGNKLSPLTAQGIVVSTYPQPPVKINKFTRIHIKKISLNKINEIKEENLLKKEQRAEILQKELDQKRYEIIQNIKKYDYPTKTISYDFKRSNPKQLFTAILDLFKMFEVVETPEEKMYYGIDNTLIYSALFITQDFSDSNTIIDIQILPREDNGALIFRITSENEELIEKYYEKYDNIISEIIDGVENKVIINEEYCPCGAPLCLEKIRPDGSIKCLYCKKIFLVPKSYRY